ncbi:MAG: hypothetical protein M5U34_25260 [Chloroflexi bacterium]|nr:hypothetical protein [Chloroflexota bacterium]
MVRDRNGYVAEIVEVAEARLRPNTPELLAIRELNVGVYCFDGPWLWQQIHALPCARPAPARNIISLIWWNWRCSKSGRWKRW